MVFGVPLNNKLVVPPFFFLLGVLWDTPYKRIVVPYAWVNVLVAKDRCSERYNACKCIATLLNTKGA